MLTQENEILSGIAPKAGAANRTENNERVNENEL